MSLRYLKTLSRANRLIANSDIRSVILENKTTDVKSLKYYYFVLTESINDFTSVVLISNMVLLVRLFAKKLTNLILITMFLFKIQKELCGHFTVFIPITYTFCNMIIHRIKFFFVYII